MNLLPCDGHLTLYENFLEEDHACNLFENLLTDINWQTETIKIFNKSIICPRLISWYGDEGLNYKYSGNSHLGIGWYEPLLPLKQNIENFLNKDFNFVLCNYYRNGDEYMGWHDDGEKEVAETIASISLGASRKFELKHKSKKIKESFLLTPGSLLVMDGDLQQYWSHRLPKDKNCLDKRINITFRKIS